MAKLDEIDTEILRELEQDARNSYRSIAKKLGISVGTVHNRISKLKKDGILRGFLLDLDTMKLGYNLKFLILLTIEGKYTQDVLEIISEYPQITNIYHITGDQTAALICRFKEMEEVQKFINRLNQIPHILKTSSNMILNTFKEDEHNLFSLSDSKLSEKSFENKQNAIEGIKPFSKANY